MLFYDSQNRNARTVPEESGPFGQHRSLRSSTSRSRGRTRTTTPGLKEKDANVAEFERLFNEQQQRESQLNEKPLTSTTTVPTLDSSRIAPEAVATECILYGYKDKENEWKVLSKYEKISGGIICEDYPRADPNISSRYPTTLTGGAVVVHQNLSKDALKKANTYRGGAHWIKVTFDSWNAADRACYYSPQEIDGHTVICELYAGTGPPRDQPLLKGSAAGKELVKPQSRTLTTSQSTSFLQSHPQNPFDRAAAATLPRSFTTNDTQQFQNQYQNQSPPPPDSSSISSTTASSATATDLQASAPPQAPSTFLRQRTAIAKRPESEFMTHIPSVRRAVLRPMDEALPPAPSAVQYIIKQVPILSWFSGDILDGPILKDDGTFDTDKSGVYWRFWYLLDKALGTDMCGLKDDD